MQVFIINLMLWQNKLQPQALELQKQKYLDQAFTLKRKVLFQKNLNIIRNLIEGKVNKKKGLSPFI